MANLSFLHMSVLKQLSKFDYSFHHDVSSLYLLH